MPKVSVIVPVYKAEKFIAQCVDSILNQTMSDLEVILVDDGSPDSSSKMCDELAQGDNRIKVFHQENGGVCAARNTGLENAQGKYIFFVDSDDYIPYDAIETLYNDAVNNKADLSIGRMYDNEKNEKKEDELQIWTGKEGIINALQDNPALYGCCSKLFKKTLIGDIRFAVGRRVHEDGYFTFLNLIKQPVITVRNKCTYIYRYNPDSASHEAFSDKYFDVLHIEEIKRKIIEEQFPELMELAYNKLVRAHITMLHLFLRTDDKRYNKDIRNSVKIIRKFSKYFIPINPSEKRFFLIAKFGGYPLFRRLYRLKGKAN